MNEKIEVPKAAKTSGLAQEDSTNLKTAREARGLSLDDVFNATRISKINLVALEDYAFDSLPPPVYTRDYIRKYAQAIGIDEKPLLKRYEKHMEGLTPPHEETEIQKPWPEDGRRYRFLFGILAAVIVAGVLVYTVFLYDQSGKSISPAKTDEPTPQAQVVSEPSDKAASAKQILPVQESLSTVPPAPATTQTPSAVPAGLPPVASAPGKTVHLAIETKELTWIRITEDRNPSYQLLLKPGEKVERTAADFFLLDIGNAGGINLIFQGKPLGDLGKPGQVIHIRLPEKTQENTAP